MECDEDGLRVFILNQLRAQSAPHRQDECALADEGDRAPDPDEPAAMGLNDVLQHSTVLGIAPVHGDLQDPLMKMSNSVAVNILREHARVQQRPQTHDPPRYGTTPIRIVSSQRYNDLSKRRWFQPGLLLLVNADAADYTPCDDEYPIEAYLEGLPEGVYAKWSAWKPRKDLREKNLHCKNLYWRAENLDGLDGLWKSRLDRQSGSHVAYAAGLKRRSAEMYDLN